MLATVLEKLRKMSHFTVYTFSFAREIQVLPKSKQLAEVSRKCKQIAYFETKSKQTAELLKKIDFFLQLQNTVLPDKKSSKNA